MEAAMKKAIAAATVLSNEMITFDLLFVEERTEKEHRVEVCSTLRDTLAGLAADTLPALVNSGVFEGLVVPALKGFRFVHGGKILDSAISIADAGIRRGDVLFACAGPGTFPQIAERLKARSLLYAHDGDAKVTADAKAAVVGVKRKVPKSEAARDAQAYVKRRHATPARRAAAAAPAAAAAVPAAAAQAVVADEETRALERAAAEGKKRADVNALYEEAIAAWVSDVNRMDMPNTWIVHYNANEVQNAYQQAAEELGLDVESDSPVLVARARELLLDACPDPQCKPLRSYAQAARVAAEEKKRADVNALFQSACAGWMAEVNRTDVPSTWIGQFGTEVHNAYEQAAKELGVHLLGNDSPVLKARARELLLDTSSGPQCKPLRSYAHAPAAAAAADTDLRYGLVDIRGIDKHVLLEALWSRAVPVVAGVKYVPPSDKTNWRFEYHRGRSIKSDISGDYAIPWGYDRACGKDALQKVVHDIRSRSAVPKECAQAPAAAAAAAR